MTISTSSTKPKKLAIDIETYSSVDLGTAGVYRYCESDDFEILLFGYSIDDGPVIVLDLAAGMPIPDNISAMIKDEQVEKWAFNAQFERVCLSSYILPSGYLNPKGWHCSMVLAAYFGLPLSLEKCGEALYLDKQKLTEGRDLIRYFCKPCLPTITNNEMSKRKRRSERSCPDYRYMTIYGKSIGWTNASMIVVSKSIWTWSKVR